jgi:hypothetical protein
MNCLPGWAPLSEPEPAEESVLTEEERVAGTCVDGRGHHWICEDPEAEPFAYRCEDCDTPLLASDVLVDQT